jgi:hypothetical protein
VALTGDQKENYVGLHLSTGETYASMAARLTTPEVLQHLDQAGRDGNKELADWLLKQTDDTDTVDKFRRQGAYAADAAQERSAAGTSKDQTPAGRTAGGKTSA